jgi:hypothetical protein
MLHECHCQHGAAPSSDSWVPFHSQPRISGCLETRMIPAVLEKGNTEKLHRRKRCWMRGDACNLDPIKCSNHSPWYGYKHIESLSFVWAT